MRVSSVVLDASAALRAYLDESEDAGRWFERIEAGDVVGAWPELVYVEVAHGIRRLIRGHHISAERGLDTLRSILRAPLEAERLALLVEPAFALAAKRRISAYDACYVVLAETLDVPLVTSDRRLAGATPNAVLV